MRSQILLTVSELAEALAVRPSWVYRAAAGKAIPLVRVGKHLRFDLDDVLATLRSKTDAGSSECEGERW